MPGINFLKDSQEMRLQRFDFDYNDAATFGKLQFVNDRTQSGSTKSGGHSIVHSKLYSCLASFG